MTYHNPVPTCTAISVNGYFPLYTTPSCAQTHAGGNGTYHTHLLNSITYYMPSGLVLGVTFFHGDYGVTTTVETTTDGIEKVAGKNNTIVTWWCDEEVNMATNSLSHCCIQGTPPNSNFQIFSTQQDCQDNTSCCNSSTTGMDSCCGGIEQGDPCTYNSWNNYYSQQNRIDYCNTNCTNPNSSFYLPYCPCCDGCIDPTATNFNQGAVNDCVGTQGGNNFNCCTYPTILPCGVSTLVWNSWIHMSPSEEGTWGSSGDIDCCQMLVGNFVGPYGDTAPQSMLQTHCNQEWININGTSAQPNGWTGCCGAGGRPGPVAPILESQDGFTYKTPRGTIWPGLTHNMDGGQVMSGGKHDINGSGPKGRSEILTRIHIVYLTPSGKQWCGDKHKSMLGTLMSGKERDVFGSGPDGKSETLSQLPLNAQDDNLYYMCDDDDGNAPSWDCTVGGCMLIPSWWPAGQFTGPNAQSNCTAQCISWMCGDVSIPWGWLTFDFCFCFEVVGTGATQTYPTKLLCDAATQTDPCCTDDENTYNCTINGCEVHTGPGIGTYNQVPYALYECEQDCVAWGCHDVNYSSANTETGYSYTVITTATTQTSGATGLAWTLVQDSGTTTVGGSVTDLCIMVFFDTTSMGANLINTARNAISNWMVQEQTPVTGILSAWTGEFMNHNMPFGAPGGQTTPIGGYSIGGELWLRWPGYAMSNAESAYGNMPCTYTPGNPTSTSCKCRNILNILLIDETHAHYHQMYPAMDVTPTTNANNNGSAYSLLTDRTTFKNNYDGWVANGGQSTTLIYTAKESFTACTATNNPICLNPNPTPGAPPLPGLLTAAASQLRVDTYATFATQVFLLTQGDRLNPANGTVGYNAITNNAETWTPVGGTVAFPIFGNPAQTSLVPTVQFQTPIFDFGSWITQGGTGAWTNPFINDEPLEDRSVFGIYDRRGLNSFTVSTLGEDLTQFIKENPLTSTTYTYTLVSTVTSSTSTWQTYASHTYTAVTSNTTTIYWTLYDQCLSAQTIPTPDYPYTAYTGCNEWECNRPGYECGVDGCYFQINGTFFNEHKCNAYCRSWSCETRNLGIVHEGLASTQLGEPHHCHEVFPAGILPGQSGNPSLYQPVTGDTYDFVKHCFNQFNAMTSYPPPVITGLVLGGLWDNIGTSFTAGFPNTTTQNGLVVHEGAGGNCETWHPQAPLIPGRITKLNGFALVDLNGNNIYHLGNSGLLAGQSGSFGGANPILSMLEIIHELENGFGLGWAMGGANQQSPDFPSGMSSAYVGQGKSLDELITYGNINPYKQFTVEVWVYGCPCRHDCWCKPVPGIDPFNLTTWDMNLPNSHSKCTEHCCDRYTTWECPESTYWRDYYCNGCPNGGGCIDPGDGSGIHSTKALCEDVCEVSWNCHQFDSLLTLSSWNTPTTCPNITEYLPLNVPELYFKSQEPTFTQRGQSIKGYIWNNKPYQYGNHTFHQLGVGVSNAFEAFIYIFDETKMLHNTEFNQIGFWTGSHYDPNDIWCEYPNSGDKNLGMMEGYLNHEFTTMYCIDYELRVNKRPWMMTEDPMVNGTPHPLAYTNMYYFGLVDGAAEVCNRDFQAANSNEEHLLTKRGDPNPYWHHWRPLSPLWINTYTSVKELKDKIKFIYSAPDYVDPYGWNNYQLFTDVMGNVISKNKVNIGIGACHKLSGDLAKLFNPGPDGIKCISKDGSSFNRPHPSNGFKPNLKLKDFWTIGMFRQNELATYHSRFTPYRGYAGFLRYGESASLQNQGLDPYSNVNYTNFMTLSYSNQSVKPGVFTLGGVNDVIGLRGRQTQPTSQSSISSKITHFECQCYVSCHCVGQNDLFGDYLKEQQCHHDCCPGEYVEICCNTTPPQATPTTVGKVVNFLSPFPPHCPPGLHQVSCPW